MNEIDKVREEIERGLVSAQFSPDSSSTELSPCGRYQIEFRETLISAGMDFAVAVVRRTDTGQEVVTLKRNDSRCFYGWVSRSEQDYLLFPEDLEGQTVINLTTGEVAGYYSPDDAFIWCEYYPSPDRTKIAILGCHWACPYQVTIYDFQNPLDLPLPTLAEFVLPRNDAAFQTWINETAFQVRSEDGSISTFEIPITI